MAKHWDSFLSYCKLLNPQGAVFCETYKLGNLYPMPIHVLMPESARVAMVQLEEFPSEGDAALHTDKVLVVSNVTSRADAHTWHRCLGHLHDSAVLHMVKKGMVQGMEITGGGANTINCEPCIKGKQTRAEILKETKLHTDTVLGRVFSDMCGKLTTRSIEGFEYFVTFINDKSQKVFMQGLKKKSEVSRFFKDFVTHAEADTGYHVKVLCSNGGCEYIGEEFVRWLDGKGIARKLTTPDTPQHNGVAERMNRTLLDKVQTMLTDADLPGTYWHDALLYAALLHNVLPTRALEDITPKEAWSCNKPDVSCLRVFGCQAFIHIPAAERTKLAAKSLICTFLGNAQNRAAYRLVHWPTCRFLVSRDVIFDEGGPAFDRVILKENITDTRALDSAPTSTSQTLPTSNPSSPNPTTSPQPTPPSLSQNPTPNKQSSSSTIIRSSNAPSKSSRFIPPSALPRPKRATRTPMCDDDPCFSVSSYGWQHSEEHARVAKANNTGDPRTYAEAMARPDAADWEMACDAERRTFESMGVYDVVPCPKGRKVVGSHWAFCIKRGPDGAILKYKACLVAQGFT